MEDEAIIERLTAVRGIGRWTVEMLLMFRLGRPDVLPADDYGIRKGFAIAFKKRELPTRKQLENARQALEAVPHGGELVPVARGGAGEEIACGVAAEIGGNGPFFTAKGAEDAKASQRRRGIRWFALI